MCIAWISCVLGYECKWYVFGASGCCCNGNNANCSRWSMLARWSSWNMGLSQWFGNHYLCSICRFCRVDNELFVMCGPWFPSNVDTDGIGFMYCTYCDDGARSHGPCDGNGCNHNFNSIWCRMFNKRHDRHISIRSRNGDFGVHTLRNVNCGNCTKHCDDTYMCRRRVSCNMDSYCNGLVHRSGCVYGSSYNRDHGWGRLF